MAFELMIDRPRLFRFIVNTLRNPLTWRTSPARLLRFVPRGFTIENIRWYDLREKAQIREFFPHYWQFRLTIGTNLGVWPLLHDKELFEAFFADKLPVVTSLFVLHRGEARRGGLPIALTEVVSALRERGELVLKPSQGGMSEGVSFLSFTNGKYLWDGQPVSESALLSKLRERRQHLVQAVLPNHPVFEALAPGTRASVRVLTFVDCQGLPRIHAAYARMSTRRSHPFECWYKGGFASWLDVQTGRTRHHFTVDRNGAPLALSAHPDTRQPLPDYEIPHWQEICAALTGFVGAHPAFDFVGWDVMLTPAGFLILEGNHVPGIMPHFLFQPLRKSPALFAFMQARGLLDGLPLLPPS